MRLRKDSSIKLPRSALTVSGQHRAQRADRERGLDGGAVDKLLVGLGEDDQLNLYRPLFSQTSSSAVSPLISC